MSVFNLLKKDTLEFFRANNLTAFARGLPRLALHHGRTTIGVRLFSRIPTRVVCSTVGDGSFRISRHRPKNVMTIELENYCPTMGYVISRMSKESNPEHGVWSASFSCGKRMHAENVHVPTHEIQFRRLPKKKRKKFSSDAPFCHRVHGCVARLCSCKVHGSLPGLQIPNFTRRSVISSFNVTPHSQDLGSDVEWCSILFWFLLKCGRHKCCLKEKFLLCTSSFILKTKIYSVHPISS